MDWSLSHVVDGLLYACKHEAVSEGQGKANGLGHLQGCLGTQGWLYRRRYLVHPTQPTFCTGNMHTTNIFCSVDKPCDGIE